MSLFPCVFGTKVPFSRCMESASCVFSFRIVFFYLVTTGWIFDIISCENSKNSIRAIGSVPSLSGYYAIAYRWRSLPIPSTCPLHTNRGYWKREARAH